MSWIENMATTARPQPNSRRRRKVRNKRKLKAAAQKAHRRGTGAGRALRTARRRLKV